MSVKPRVLILRAPGTNCDVETEYAFTLAGAECQRVHVRALLESPSLLREFRILCLPGGFSYGDDIAAGRILAQQLTRQLGEAMLEFRDREGLILGICNGFQVLLQSSLLIEGNRGPDAVATLTRNRSGVFETRWVWLETLPSPSIFLRGVTRMYLPVAHAEGRFVVRQPSVLRQLAEHRQFALLYASAQEPTPSDPERPIPFPENPNGSQANVAGLCDVSGRVLGLMPHPERFVTRTQHPRWTRESIGPEGDGLQLFRNAVQYCS